LRIVSSSTGSSIAIRSLKVGKFEIHYNEPAELFNPPLGARFEPGAYLIGLLFDCPTLRESCIEGDLLGVKIILETGVSLFESLRFYLISWRVRKKKIINELRHLQS